MFLLCVAASLTLFELVFLPPHLYDKEVRGEGYLYIVLFNTNVWLGLIVRYLLSIHNILLVFEIVLSVLLVVIPTGVIREGFGVLKYAFFL